MRRTGMISRLPAITLGAVVALFAGLPIADAQAPSYLYMVSTDTALDTQTGSCGSACRCSSSVWGSRTRCSAVRT